VPARITLISHAATLAQRHAAFPSTSREEPIEDGERTKLSALNWQPPVARQILVAPELRTRQTAEALHLVATPANELRDCNYGSWQGRSLSDLQSEEPVAVIAWLTDPTFNSNGGEAITDLLLRIANWLETLHNTGHTIAVTHPAIIRAAILHTLNAPPPSFWRIDIAPLTLTDLRHNGRAWTLRTASTPLAKHDAHEAE
jgi:broad specificity phosphatase PhoE